MTKVRGASNRAALVNCEEAREAISARTDGEELPIDAYRLDAHLTHCPGCRDFAAQVVAIRHHVGLTSARLVPEQLIAALTSVAEASQPRSTWLTRRRPLARTRIGWVNRAQWAGAAVPAALAVAAICMGAGSHQHLVPTHTPSPCTAGLVAHHPSEGG